ncbi:hypothetical protein EC844_10290 [Acinetobacter calcoaceticus]|uniref:Uncharacterized protein n=1 Tax=Acinetobacter calcoaceticus TaxID=471 RepID=A0A4R1Y026_ACICA|nr:hypothetical protein EC844_10290 [Acinetobacter calcoaceticus]
MSLKHLLMQSSLLMMTALSSVALHAQASQMIALNDRELSEVEGQALLSMTYLAPNDSLNKMAGQGVGFYKLGLEALLELNANIRKLQLGCGGINGPGGCDLDIDHLSLSGLSESRNGRVGSSAEMSNPFIEFAIRNPESAAQREVLGLRMSAEKVKGLLTLGLENSATSNGINSFSGYMKIKDATGTAYTQARNMTYDDTDMMLEGWASVLFVDKLKFRSEEYDLALGSTAASLRIKGQTISGSRLSSVMLNGIADIGDIRLKGDLTAEVAFLPVRTGVVGSVGNIKANVSINQNLGYIHRLPLNNPFSLSMQSAKVHWPGASEAAGRGWWMAFEDEIDIGNVTPSERIVITNDVLKQLIGPINGVLDETTLSCTLLLCGIPGIDIQLGHLDLKGATVDFPLKDLQLKNQGFAPNCYGNLKFC